MAGALIVTVEFGLEDQAAFDRLRAAHYPHDRNVLHAHLTMFHALPPSAEAEVRNRLAEASRESPPRARLHGLMDLGGGVALRIVSDDLDRIRGGLADGLAGLLSAQDNGGWRPHVTIQNKVPVKQARALLTALEGDFRPREVAICGLGLHRYLGGPWQRLAVYPFRGR